MSTKKPEYTESQRMINMGIPCETKKLGTLTVKELPLESIIELGGELSDLFQTLVPEFSDASKTGRKQKEPTGDSAKGIAFIGKLVSDPKTFSLLRKIAAKSTDRAPVDFQDMGLTDWLKWLTTFKKVTDWEELRELFFELIPPRMLQIWSEET